MTSKIRIALASILAIAALGAIAPAANAYVYWVNNSDNTIGRASLSGLSPNQSFITGADAPNGIAVDGRYIYWSNFSGNSIGRANLDGSSPDQNFMTSVTSPLGVAVDSNYIYWTTGVTIGRADLDGGNPNSNFIIPGGATDGIAVDGNYIYWTSSSNNTIGRASLNGTGANSNFITGAASPYGVAVDGSHVYWTNFGANSIGRANLDGTTPDQSFLDAQGPFGIAVDEKYVYWAGGAGFDSIGRANLDGTGTPDQSFITGGALPRAVAVNALPKPTVSRSGKPTKRSLKVRIGCGDSAACSLRLTGKKVGGNARVVAKTVAVGAGQKPVVLLTYTSALRRALVKGGRVSITASDTATGQASGTVVRVAK